MKAVGYARVSSRQQADSGLGEAAQQAAIAEYAARLSLPLTQFADRAIEGDTPIEKRPGLLDALGALAKGDVLVVARFDRLGRDVILSTLIEREVSKRGAKTISCAGEASGVEGPGGELVRTILFAMAAYEKAVIAIRTRAALRALRGRGQRAGALPYGHTLSRDGRTLLPDPSAQSTIALIRGQRAAGMSCERIAASLNECGVKAPRGKQWWASGIRSVLRTAARAESAV